MNAGLRTAAIGLALAAFGLAGRLAPMDTPMGNFMAGGVRVGFITCALIVVICGLVQTLRVPK